MNEQAILKALEITSPIYRLARKRVSAKSDDIIQPMFQNVDGEYGLVAKNIKSVLEYNEKELKTDAQILSFLKNYIDRAFSQLLHDDNSFNHESADMSTVGGYVPIVDTPSAHDLSMLLLQLPKSYRNTAVWISNDTWIKNTLGLEKVPLQLMSRRVYASEHMSFDIPIVFVDLSHGLFINLSDFNIDQNGLFGFKFAMEVLHPAAWKVGKIIK